MYKPENKRIRTMIAHAALASVVILFSGTSAGESQANLVRVGDQEFELQENGEMVLRDSGKNKSERAIQNNGQGTGNGKHTCQIIVLNQGYLGAGLENDVLSSKIFGGQSGKASVTTTRGSYRLMIDPPIGFSAMPASSNPSVNMFASYLGSGVTNFSETPGTIPVKLGKGTTMIETHLVASTPGGEPFPAGQYSTQLTLRCE